MLIQDPVDQQPVQASTLRRPWWTRASGAHLLMVTAGIVAFLANVAVLRSHEDTVDVAVASTDLDEGSRIEPGTHLRFVAVHGDADALDGLVTRAEVSSKADQRILATSVRAGEMLIESQLVRAATRTGLRLFSISIRPERAVGGDVEVGDRIDVITVDTGGAEYVSSGLEVVGVADTQRGAFSAAGAFFVTVAVDDRQVLRLAEAADSSEIMIVRSTGAPPPRPSDVDTGSVAPKNAVP